LKTKFTQWVDQLQPQQPADSAQTQATIAAALHQGSHRGRKVAGIVAAAAVALVLGSGIAVPGVNQALTQVPVVGRFFALFGDDMGSIVESSGRDQKLNVSRSSNGMKMTLNSAVMQGMSVAITGTISGVDGQKDDWFNFQVAKGGVHFAQDSMDVRRIGNGKYRFYLNGTVPYAASKRTVKMPLVFDNFVGHSGRWAFNLELQPNKASQRVLGGSVDIADGHGRAQLLSVEEYAGGTSLLKVRQQFEQKHDGFDILNLMVDGKDYLLDPNRIVLKKESSTSRVVGYRIKTLPKHIKRMTIGGYYYAPEYSKRLELGKLNGVTIKSQRSDAQFTIQSVKRSDDVVRVFFNWQGGHNHFPFTYLAKNNQYPFALMAKTYHDNHNDSVLGDDYIYMPDTSEGSQDRSVTYQQVPGKHLIEARFDLSGKKELRNLPMSQLQLQVDYTFDENISYANVAVPLTK
jgi:hypothetical protein